LSTHLLDKSQMGQEDHKLAAIVFTDIVGYTRQMEENEQKTMQLLQRQRDIVFPLVQTYGGEVIKEMGDGLLMMFRSAVEAVRFAIALQNRLKDDELNVRAGIHIGDVVFRDGDVFGSAVNIAARIEPLAPPKGICISEDVRNQLANKADIKTIPRGRKELKGVRMPVDIHEVYLEGISKPIKNDLKSTLAGLWKRSVIQVAVFYLLVAWLLKLAIGAWVSQNLFSPYLADLSWVILLSLLPTIVLITLFRGRASSPNGRKWKTFGIPANVLLAVLLSFMLFRGKELGAITTHVTLENEDGEMISRRLMKSEFRKNISIFPFDYQSADKESNWLQYGIPLLMELDLGQDIFIRAASMTNYFEKIKEAGFDDGLNLPLTLKKKLAEQNRLNYFVSGSYKKQNDLYVLSTDVYETQSGRLISGFVIEDSDVFRLIDRQTIAVKHAVGIPEAHINNAPDLPVKEITSSSLPAFESFVKGHVASVIESDWDKAIKLLGNSVTTDPGFALAHLYLAQYYLNNNQFEKITGSLETVMDNLYKLPEQKQFLAKIYYYLMRQESEKAIAVNQMWIDLFPEDIQAYVVIAQRYQLANKFEEAIRAYQTILHLDPSQDNYLISIGNQFSRLGQLDSALVYYQQFERNNPQNPLSYRKLGEHYLKITEFGKAHENYEKASLLEPNNISFMLNLAEVQLYLEMPQKIEPKLMEILSRCSLAKDSGTVYSKLAEYHLRVGKIKKAIQFNELAFDHLKTVYTPKDILVWRTFIANLHVMAGDPEKSLAVLQEIEKKLHPPIDKIIAFGYMLHYIEAKHPAKAKSYIGLAMEIIEGFGEQMLLPNIYYSEGKIAELEGDHDKMLDSFKKYLELQPGIALGYQLVATAYRKSGNLPKAEEYIQQALDSDPFNPKNLLEAAYIYLDQSNPRKANEMVALALKIWVDADPSFSPAEEARQLLAQMSGV
jgi:class 3 adenylate cyclase/tetratricopeptide (TPR) repeat protein/TolB-like protein